jgi:hypothetical protein
MTLRHLKTGWMGMRGRQSTRGASLGRKGLKVEGLEPRAMLAGLAVSIESSGGTTVLVEDNMPGDLNAALGAILYSGTVDDFIVNVVTGLSHHQPALARLDFSSVTVTS